MNLSPVFFGLIAAASFTNYMDWATAVKNGPANEKNPLMKFLLSKSKYAALAYKAFGIGLITYLGYFKYRDVQNIGVEYSNAPGQYDYWGYVALGIALTGAIVGLIGWRSGAKKI